MILRQKRSTNNGLRKQTRGDRFADCRSARGLGRSLPRRSFDLDRQGSGSGINLQFCNLVVKVRLPWNPQRIEQRIGRCHRYGQKFDVVVVNFLNKTNAADQRVYQLLDQEFRLFDGVFGASDEVLGAVEIAFRLPKRILATVDAICAREDLTRSQVFRLASWNI